MSILAETPHAAECRAILGRERGAASIASGMDGMNPDTF
jgi:hypothetical protein